MKEFDYACPHGNLIDEYALFANIVSKTDKTITFGRYMNFGKIKCPNPITVPIEDFNKYYVKYKDLWKYIRKTRYNKTMEIKNGKTSGYYKSREKDKNKSS